MKTLASLALLIAACGGCPWTNISPIQTTPATSCLTLDNAGGGGNAPSTGCVDPVLVGHNGCADALVIPASATNGSVDLTFQPGDDIQFEVPLGIATFHSDNNSDRYDWSIDAMVGTQPVTLAFHGGL